MKGRRFFLSVLVLALLTAVTVGLGQAQEPGAGAESQHDPAGVEDIVIFDIPIQGRLTDGAGKPVPDGVHAITFRLYNAEVGGDLLVEDTDHPDIANGLFTTLVGPCAADDINGQELWLEVQVEGDEVMLPRREIAPVPYALSLRPGAVISDTLTYVELNGGVDHLLSHAGVIGKAVGPGSLGVYGRIEGGTGAAIYGESASGSGWGGILVSTVPGGVGVRASAGDDNTADVELGSSGTPATGDDGRIQSTDFGSSDMLLVSNDNTEFHLDENDDEDGVFRIHNGADNQILGAYETGLVRLNINAGYAQPIAVGDRYRDNAIVAWASVGLNGTVLWEFGVASVVRVGVGVYRIELDAHAADVTALIPMAIAEVEGTPDSAAEIRIVSIDQSADNTFRVYINNGNWDLVDNDFVFMVTAR